MSNTTNLTGNKLNQPKVLVQYDSPRKEAIVINVNTEDCSKVISFTLKEMTIEFTLENGEIYATRVVQFPQGKRIMAGTVTNFTFPLPNNKKLVEEKIEVSGKDLIKSTHVAGRFFHG